MVPSIFLKKLSLLFTGLLCVLQLNGCATGTAGLECGVESMNPTILSALDSFESAAISIKLSNRILLETPIHENDKWPSELYGVPSGAALLKMGLSLFGASQGVTIPTEIDPQTGFPRPTSALYIFLKEREQLLNREIVREDVRFFASQPPNVIARQLPSYRRRPGVQLIDDNIYRNPLMAYGVVTANKQDMVKLQQEIDLIARGFKVCDAWVHKSREGDVKPAACKDPALKQDALENRLKKASYSPSSTNPAPATQPDSSASSPKVDSFGNPVTESAVDKLVENSNPEPPRKKITARSKRGKNKKARGRRTRQAEEEAVVAQTSTDNHADSSAAYNRRSIQSANYTNGKIMVVNEQDRLAGEKTEELETMRKNYGKLAGRVYNASVAGADFTMAAITKITCAIVNGVRAFPNANNEIRGWRGAYNAAMLLPRIKGVINAFGYYRDNLGLQFVAYRTMYQQIKGTYPELKDDDPAHEQKTTEAMLRVEQAVTTFKQLEPKLALLAKGGEVEFTDGEIDRINRVASMFPSNREAEQRLMLAWGIRP